MTFQEEVEQTLNRAVLFKPKNATVRARWVILSENEVLITCDRYSGPIDLLFDYTAWGIDGAQICGYKSYFRDDEKAIAAILDALKSYKK